jgi:hypothetical protein
MKSNPNAKDPNWQVPVKLKGVEPEAIFPLAMAQQHSAPASSISMLARRIIPCRDDLPAVQPPLMTKKICSAFLCRKLVPIKRSTSWIHTCFVIG